MQHSSHCYATGAHACWRLFLQGVCCMLWSLPFSAWYHATSICSIIRGVSAFVLIFQYDCTRSLRRHDMISRPHIHAHASRVQSLAMKRPKVDVNATNISCTRIDGAAECVHRIDVVVHQTCERGISLTGIRLRSPQVPCTPPWSLQRGRASGGIFQG